MNLIAWILSLLESFTKLSKIGPKSIKLEDSLKIQCIFVKNLDEGREGMLITVADDRKLGGISNVMDVSINIQSSFDRLEQDGLKPS